MSGPRNIPVPRRGAMPAIGIDQIKPGNSLMVSPGNYGAFSTLQAAYDWLASSDRDGEMGALSETNCRALVLSPGAHHGPLILSHNYVNVVALCPSSGNWTKDSVDYHILWTDDPSSTGESTGEDPDTWFSPPSTYVFVDADDDEEYAVKQTANDVKLYGFGIVNFKRPVAWGFDAVQGNSAVEQYYALYLDHATGDNSLSHYELMYFWKSGAYAKSNGYLHSPVFSEDDLGGTWKNCIANGFAWRVAAGKSVKAFMYDCVGGVRSWGGDFVGANISGEFYRCACVGTLDEDTTGNGYGAWGGCTNFGCAITSSAIFMDCVAGNKSYALGFTCAGTFYSCLGGAWCFGSTVDSSYAGSFTGLAVNCIAFNGSFGGTSQSDYGGLSGKLDNCKKYETTSQPTSYPTKLTSGATLYNCTWRHGRIAATASFIASGNITVNFYGCHFMVKTPATDLLIDDGGYSVSLNMAHCRTNSTAGTAGLDTGVTNAVTEGYNVSDAAITAYW